MSMGGTPRPCLRCHTLNPPGSNYCLTCGRIVLGSHLAGVQRSVSAAVLCAALFGVLALIGKISDRGEDTAPPAGGPLAGAVSTPSASDQSAAPDSATFSPQPAGNASSRIKRARKSPRPDNREVHRRSKPSTGN